MNGGKPLTLSHLTSIYAQATHRFYSEVQTISFGSDCYLGMCYFNTQKTTIDDIHSPPPSCKRASSSVGKFRANSVGLSSLLPFPQTVCVCTDGLSKATSGTSCTQSQQAKQLHPIYRVNTNTRTYTRVLPNTLCNTHAYP